MILSHRVAGKKKSQGRTKHHHHHHHHHHRHAKGRATERKQTQEEKVVLGSCCCTFLSTRLVPLHAYNAVMSKDILSGDAATLGVIANKTLGFCHACSAQLAVVPCVTLCALQQRDGTMHAARSGKMRP